MLKFILSLLNIQALYSQYDTQQYQSDIIVSIMRFFVKSNLLKIAVDYSEAPHSFTLCYFKETLPSFGT